MSNFPEMKFGKFKGKTLDQCPAEYLQWCLDNLDFDKYPKSPMTREKVKEALAFVEDGGVTPSDTNTGVRWDTVSQRLQLLPKVVREFEMKHHPQQGRIEFMDALCDMVEELMASPDGGPPW